MPSRRAVLASVAASVAGCLGARRSDAPTTGTDTPTATPTTAPPTTAPPAKTPPTVEPDASLEAAHVQHSVLYLSAPDAFGVAAAEGRQYVFVPATGTSPERFALVADESHAASARLFGGPATTVAWPDETARIRLPSPEQPDGWLLFEVPAPLGGDAAEVRWSDGESSETWAFDDARVAALTAAPPSVSVEAVEAPDEVEADEPFDVVVTAENGGDGDGVFRGALNRAGPMYGATPLREPIEAGGRATVRRRVSYRANTDLNAAELRFSVVAPGETFERTVALR